MLEILRVVAAVAVPDLLRFQGEPEGLRRALLVTLQAMYDFGAAPRDALLAMQFGLQRFGSSAAKTSAMLGAIVRNQVGAGLIDASAVPSGLVPDRFLSLAQEGDHPKEVELERHVAMGPIVERLQDLIETGSYRGLTSVRAVTQEIFPDIKLHGFDLLQIERTAMAALLTPRLLPIAIQLLAAGSDPADYFYFALPSDHALHQLDAMHGFALASEFIGPPHSAGRVVSAADLGPEVATGVFLRDVMAYALLTGCASVREGSRTDSFEAKLLAILDANLALASELGLDPFQEGEEPSGLDEAAIFLSTGSSSGLLMLIGAAMKLRAAGQSVAETADALRESRTFFLRFSSNPLNEIARVLKEMAEHPGQPLGDDVAIIETCPFHLEPAFQVPQGDTAGGKLRTGCPSQLFGAITGLVTDGDDANVIDWLCRTYADALAKVGTANPNRPLRQWTDGRLC